MRLPLTVVAAARLLSSVLPAASCRLLSRTVSDLMPPTDRLPEKPSLLPLAANSEVSIVKTIAAFVSATSPVWLPANTLLRTSTVPPATATPAPVPSVRCSPVKANPSTTASVLTVSSARAEVGAPTAVIVTSPPAATRLILVRTVAKSFT